MIGFFSGFLVGFLIGFIAMAIMAAGSDADDEMERFFKERDDGEQR